MMRHIQCFPHVCAPLLIYTEELSTADILEAIYVDEQETEFQPGDSITLAFLKRYIQDCDNGEVTYCC